MEHGADAKSCNDLVTKYHNEGKVAFFRYNYPNSNSNYDLNLKKKIELLIEYGATTDDIKKEKKSTGVKSKSSKI